MGGAEVNVRKTALSASSKNVMGWMQLGDFASP
jgi:hypothetical protein